MGDLYVMPNTKMTYEVWLGLDKVERISLIDEINPYSDYSDHPILNGLLKDFQEWAESREDVIEVIMGNNHGSIELRAYYKNNAPYLAQEFRGLPVRALRESDRAIIDDSPSGFFYALKLILLLPFIAILGLLDQEFRMLIKSITSRRTQPTTRPKSKSE